MKKLFLVFWLATAATVAIAGTVADLLSKPADKTERPESRSVSNQFISVKLAYGSSISIPRSWKIMQGNELRAITTATGAVLDLTGYAKKLEGGETLIVSNFPDQDFYAALVVSSASMPGVTSTFVDSQSDAHMKSAEASIRKATEAIQGRIGWHISDWTPLRKVVLNGKTAMHTSYRRSSKEVERRVHLYKFFGTGRFYDVALSTSIVAEGINNLVLDKIANSFIAP